MINEKWETVFVTTSLKEFNAVKGILANSGIVHKSKTIDGSFRRGNTGMNKWPSQTTNYEILVATKDVENAKDIIFSK